jgi:hypothetical protein
MEQAAVLGRGVPAVQGSVRVGAADMNVGKEVGKLAIFAAIVALVAKVVRPKEDTWLGRLIFRGSDK